MTEKCTLCLNQIKKPRRNRSRSLNEAAKELIQRHFNEISHLIFRKIDHQTDLCSDCNNNLTQFHSFYERIADVHLTGITEVVIIKEEPLDLPDLVKDEPVEAPSIPKTQRKPKTQPNEVHELPNIRRKFQRTDEFFKKTRSNLNPEDERRIKETANMSCELCDKTFESFSHANYHYKSAHGVKGYLNCCGKKYMKRHRLLIHLNSHYNFSFPCEICGKSFYSKQLLSNHLVVHETTREFQCDHCGKAYAKKFQLSHHLMLVHVNEKTRHKCTLAGCEKSFANKFRLKHHIRFTHNNEDIAMCEICSKVLKRRDTLESHMRTHTRKPEDRFQCNICGNYLRDIKLFKRHVRNHATESMDNTCSHCGKKYPNLICLQSHIRCVHKMERNKKCQYCEKSFKMERTLVDHVASVHTLDDLYKCDYCEKTFRNHGNMHAHRKKAHPESCQVPFYKTKLV